MNDADENDVVDDGPEPWEDASDADDSPMTDDGDDESQSDTTGFDEKEMP
jgi:hypothetical protein